MIFIYIQINNCDNIINIFEQSYSLFQKPERICKFCNEFQTHLKRHITRRHKNEDEVIEALKLPLKQQTVSFEVMRKAGTYAKKLELITKRQPLIRERRQRKSETVMC